MTGFIFDDLPLNYRVLTKEGYSYSNLESEYFNPSVLSLPNNEYLIVSRGSKNKCYKLQLLDKNFKILKENIFIPDEYALVEDLRLFLRSGKIYASGTHLQNNEKDYSVSLFEINSNLDLFFIKEISKRDSKNKNWVSVDCLDTKDINFLVSSIDKVRGGTQLVKYMDGYISLVHRTYFPDSLYYDGILPNYFHSLVYYNLDYSIKKMSLDFKILDKYIEFAAGLTKMDNLYVSTFGIDDESSIIFNFSPELIEDLLESGVSVTDKTAKKLTISLK